MAGDGHLRQQSAGQDALLLTWRRADFQGRQMRESLRERICLTRGGDQVLNMYGVSRVQSLDAMQDPEEATGQPGALWRTGSMVISGCKPRHSLTVVPVRPGESDEQRLFGWSSFDAQKRAYSRDPFSR